MELDTLETDLVDLELKETGTMVPDTRTDEVYRDMEEKLFRYVERKRISKENKTMEKYRTMEDELLHPIRKVGIAGKIWIGFLSALVLCGIYAYYLQETKGKYETINLRDYTMWGVYISTFLFYVALSLVGALMSAVLMLLKFEWYRPLARIAEILALSAILMSGILIVAAMGRPEKLYYLLMYGRIQSPIVWDVIVIVTFNVASLLFLFMPLLPSIKICRDRLTDAPKWQKWLYKSLTFGWNGSAKQWTLLKRCVTILAVMVIPLAVATRTVSAWLFSTTLRAEWDSTNLGPYLVSGAFLLSTAAMIVAVYVFRKVYKFEKYLTEKHFDNMGKIMVFLSLCFMYFTVNEYLSPAYKMGSLHANYLLDLFTGSTAPLYWSVVFFGIVVPATLPLFKALRKPLPLTIIATLTVIAAWFKYYLIVVPGLLHPYLPIQDVPASWTHYTPSLVEMTIIVSSFAAVLLIVTLFSRLFPIISIWEVAEGEGFNIQKIHQPVNAEKL